MIEVDYKHPLRFALKMKPRIWALHLLALKRRVVFDRCTSEAVLRPVVRTFHFTSHGNDQVIAVKLQAEAMWAFCRALVKCPTIRPTADYRSEYSGSFRTHAQQAYRYDQYKNHGGGLAAPQCSSWHEAGVAVDLLDQSDAERKAMDDCGFISYLPQDPPHHSYRVDTRTDRTF